MFHIESLECRRYVVDFFIFLGLSNKRKLHKVYSCQTTISQDPKTFSEDDSLTCCSPPRQFKERPARLRSNNIMPRSDEMD